MIHDFNPRLREGGDMNKHVSIRQVDNFNPRLREGGDEMSELIKGTIQISIHASAKEATLALPLLVL